MKLEIIALTKISHFQKATDQVAPAVVICLNSLILRKGHTLTQGSSRASVTVCQ